MTPPTSTPGVDSGSPAGGGDDLIMRLADKIERAAGHRALKRAEWALRARHAEYGINDGEAVGIRIALDVVRGLLDEVAR